MGEGYMKNIAFGQLLFTVTDDGFVALRKCYNLDYTDGFARPADLCLCEFDVAGGSTSGWNRLNGARVTRELRYVTHTVRDSVLEIVQRSETVEVTSRFEKFDDTNAVRVTQTLKNISGEELCLEMANTVGLRFGRCVLDEHKDWYFHTFTNARYTEAMPDVRSLYDMGFYWHNRVFRVANVGNASSFENLPQGILENRRTDDLLMFQIESYYDWFYEITTSRNMFNLQIGGPTALLHAWNRILAAGEAYTTVPVTLAHGKTLNGVLAEMTKYRRHIKAHNESDRELPSVFNEYMHLSWDDPFASRALALAPYIAKAGCKYYVIDCGWHNSTEFNGKIYHVFGTWHEDRGRFPEGIKAVSDYVHSLGLKFGLWLAPEVVGDENREMIEYYGDECFFIRNGKKISHGMGHLLDFRQKKVYDYMAATIDRMVNEYGCDYIKFDGCPNAGFGTERDSTSLGNGLEEHTRAFLGWVKDMMERHPEVIFEDCFGGGMRMDYQALSMFSLISTSDQTRYDHYPYITANIFASVLPEQAAVWSYPVGSDIYKANEEEIVNERASRERVVMNMVNSVLGRIHLASRIDLLDGEKQALIQEGVRFYDRIRDDKLRSLPYLPLGYAKFGQELVATGLKCEDKLYLAVWNLGGERHARIPLPEICVKDARVAYPLSLETRFTFDRSSLTVDFTEDFQARIFEIHLS